MASCEMLPCRFPLAIRCTSPASMCVEQPGLYWASRTQPHFETASGGGARLWQMLRFLATVRRVIVLRLEEQLPYCSFKLAPLETLPQVL